MASGGGTCPKCKGTIEQVPMKGVTVDRCTSCRGLWFDQGELTLEVEVLRPFKDLTGARPSDVPCIRCAGTMMSTAEFPGTSVPVTVCPKCKGTFLEAGKLEEIRAALRAIVGESGKAPGGDRTAEIISDLAKVEAGTRCPKCEKPFESFTNKGQILDRCPQCKGTWFDAGELTAELGVSRKISLKDAAPTELDCPRCPKKKLVVVEYPKTGVNMETCPDCRGAFLEEKKLEELHAKLGAVGG